MGPETERDKIISKPVSGGAMFQTQAAGSRVHAFNGEFYGIL